MSFNSRRFNHFPEPARRGNGREWYRVGKAPPLQCRESYDGLSMQPLVGSAERTLSVDGEDKYEGSTAPWVQLRLQEAALCSLRRRLQVQEGEEVCGGRVVNNKECWFGARRVSAGKTPGGKWKQVEGSYANEGLSWHSEHAQELYVFTYANEGLWTVSIGNDARLK